MAAADIAQSSKSIVYRFGPRMRVRRAARLLLAERFESMWRRLPDALAGDAEAGIHQMRVEAKRLREAMRLFGGAHRASEFKLVLAEVDRLNDLLGQVRDADALVELCAELLDGAAAHLVRGHSETVLTARRVDLTALVSYLEELQDRGFERRFGRMTRACRHSAANPVAGQRLKNFAPIEVGRRLRKVVRRLRAVTGERDAVGLHAVRVANKHLRYAMEAFLGMYDRRFSRSYRRVVELHKALGDVHDLDVAADRLQAYAAAQGGDETLQDAVAALEQRRNREYGRVLAYLTPDGIEAFAHQVVDALE